MRERRPLIVQLVIASTIINLCGLALPLFSMAVFDRVIPHAAMETLFALGLGVCLALGLELALRHARLKLFDAVSQSAGLSLQGRLVGRLLFARSADIPRSPGGLMHPVQELDGLAAAAPQLIVALLVDLPFFLLLLVLLASIAGPVALAPLVGTALMLGLHILCHRLAHDGHGAQSTFMRRQMQTLLESVSAQERIRLTGSGPRFLGKWERAADEAAFAQHEQRFWHGLAAQGSAVLVQAVIVAAVIIGVFRIDAAAMTVGALSAAILLVNRAMMPVSLLVGLIFRMRQGLKSAAPLAGLMTAPVEAGADRAASGARITGRLDFARVSFTYPGEARPALKEISLSIRAGEKVGLIGKAGCGKSTLLRLISCLNEPGEGRIALDGRDIRQFDPRDIRRAIGAMPQDSALVEGTLEDNLTLGLEAVPRAELERVCALAGVDEIASRHPSGHALEVGPGGQRLSGGERQCVSLARSLMGRPAMLLLDEPTSALDNTLEARVLAALKAELHDKGLIVATHRLQVLALVDRVIWLDGGRIVADGPKDDVFRKFGLVA
jgi:ATP-binding cassette subfamily C protein LapB